MQIHNIKIKNFKSCYDEQEFIFDELNGLVKLSGSIGSGKTLLCEALQWGLLGSVKGQSNPSLISWNTQSCEIELNLTSKNKEVYIRRNIHEPLVVEVNGKPLVASNKRNAQTILEEDIYDIPKLAIIKMCLISFNGFSSLADMNPGQTKEFLDEIFGFKLFTEYNIIVQKEKKKIQNNIVKLSAVNDENNNQIKILEDKKEQQQIQLNTNFDLKKLTEDRKSLIDKGIKIKDTIKEIDDKYNKQETDIEKTRLEYYNKKTQLQTLGKQTKKYIETFKDGKCPTCSHPVDPKIMEEHRIKLMEYAGKVKIEEQNEQNELLKLNNIKQQHKTEIDKYQSEINNIKLNIGEIDKKISVYNSNVKLINENYDNLINEYKDKIEDINKQLKESDTSLLEWGDMEDLLTKTLRYKLLNTLIPHINKSITYFMEKLDQPYRVEYDQEFKAHIFTESFDREISYGNLSTGQKKTVDIAIIFGILQNVITNVDMNILVLDELMSNMDADARNIMLSVLKENMGENKSIFVVNHAEMNDDYFDHKIRVSLKNKKIRVQLKKRDEPKDIIVRASNYEQVF